MSEEMDWGRFFEATTSLVNSGDPVKQFLGKIALRRALKLNEPSVFERIIRNDATTGSRPLIHLQNLVAAHLEVGVSSHKPVA